MTNYIFELPCTATSNQQPATNVRDSNLELFRIITMLLILAHHYVVNSGLMEVIRSNPTSNQSIFLLLFGAWGKTGINCFVLITGYFMCKSCITMKKLLKLVLQVEFYRIIIYLIFLFTSYNNFNLTDIPKALLPIPSLTDNFTGCFLVFYLSIPFLNILIQNMTEKQHRNLLFLIGFFYVLLGSVPKFHINFNYVTWFCIIYFIGSYIRLYPPKIIENKTFRTSLFFSSVFLSCLSILIFNYISYKYGMKLQYFLLIDSNKILAVFTAISSFIYFKYLKIPSSKFINIISATTFGVFLIHANSDAMRQWLWKDFLNNVGQYGTDNLYIHAILSVVCIFVICSLIDFIRIKLLEQPLFKYIDKKLEAFINNKNNNYQLQ